jgi:hypothetical protein
MKHATLRTAAHRTLPKLLVVECFGVRRLAYRDDNGRLRDFWRRSPLPGPVLVLDPED